MCGIAVIISGVRIDLSYLLHEDDFCVKSPSSPSPASETSGVQKLLFSEEDLRDALRRRGPDRFGRKTVLLQLERKTCAEEKESSSHANGVSVLENGRNVTALHFSETKHVAELRFLSAVLQLRGTSPVLQPLVDSLGNHLIFNGEIFGGVNVGADCNDGEVLSHALEKCCPCEGQEHKESCCYEKERLTVPVLLSTIKGPWALIYWQAWSRKLWFARDAFGRRSLLVHWPTLDDPRFLLSSVSPQSSVNQSLDFEVEGLMNSLNYWEELPCGIYSISMDALKADRNYGNEYFVGYVKKHAWTDTQLKNLIKWERSLVEPKMKPSVDCSEHDQNPVLPPVHRVLATLHKSVKKRATLTVACQPEICGKGDDHLAPVAVLFSGGLDSMILAALLDQCLSSKYEIDLLNVSFDGQLAPDRISGKKGIKELREVSPSRRWRLVEIDASLSNLTEETKHVMSLINPARTYMDLNIGLALWLAASGDGWVDESDCGDLGKESGYFKYKSKAKVLLVGAGADEQCAGYARYRTKFKQGSWQALEEEMRLDMQRIWKRNLGRDDRCISDQGKEARFPFMDENVIQTLLEIPVWEIADLTQPVGKGDKKILREAARLLGLHAAAALPKRAIQFGSRIARESNRKNFGSNRAANQASAGSVIIRPQG